MKVLVVEDDPNLRTSWGSVIERAGHSVQRVETEASARELLTAEPFDLVLLDLFLGERAAIGVATSAARSNRACKVALVTGTSIRSKDELFAMAPSIWAVIRKPVDIEDILALCEHVAGKALLPPPEVLATRGAEIRR